jgi:protein associated with RNAse G/E
MPKNREQYTKEEQEIITKRILRAAKKFGIEVDPEKWKFKEGDMEKIQELEQRLKEKEKELSEFVEKDKAKEEELKKLKAEVERLNTEKRKAEFESFCEGLEREGRLTPAMKPKVLDLMEVLHNTEEFEFSEDDDKKVKKQPLEAFKELLQGLPEQVSFKEHATKGKAGESRVEIKEEFSGNVDEERLELHKKAIELSEKEGISYMDAVKKIIKEG